MKPQKQPKNYEEIYKLACQKGEEAAYACPPAPVKDSIGNVINGGVCGFGIVNFPDGRSGIARWLKMNNIGDKSYYGGVDVWFDISPTDNTWWGIQSLAPKKAYADAFVEVFKQHGIECSNACRLD